MSEAIWTVGRLIEKLRDFPKDMPIVGIYDREEVEKAQKKRSWVPTITVHDVVAIRSRATKSQKITKPNAVVIKTTGVLDLG